MASELRSVIDRYKIHLFAHRQERPARMVAALRPILASAKNLKTKLNALPQSLRMELRAGGLGQLFDHLNELIEELIAASKSRSSYWQGHVAKSRPTGEAQISLWLRQQLKELITKYSPDRAGASKQEKRTNEARRDRWVGDVLRAIEVKFPDEKKNRKRFRGHIPPNITPSAKPARRRTTKSKDARAREQRLRGVVF
jgi:hypothetical protein